MKKFLSLLDKSQSKIAHATKIKFSELYEELCKISASRNQSPIELCWLILHDKNPSKCIICGNLAKFDSMKHGYSEICSKDCGYELKKQKSGKNLQIAWNNRKSEILSKRTKTCIERFGVEHVLQSSEIKNKGRQTNLLKYGVDHPTKLKEVQEKIKKTKLETYGSFSAIGIKGTPKRIITNLSKYGVNNVGQLSLNVLKGPYSKDRLKKFQESYHKHKINNLTEKLKIIKEKESIIPLFNIEDYVGIDHDYLWKHLDCGNIFESNLVIGKIPRCIHCFGRSNPQSALYRKLIEILPKEYSIKLNDRKLLSPQEIDIVIYKDNIVMLGIEINGLYWHSEKIGTPQNYHIEKTNLAKSKGINLLQFFEHEINTKFDIICSICLSKLGLSTRLFARKLKAIEISSSIAKQFCDNNHLQGGINASFNFGLYNNTELVQVISLGKSRFKQDEIELYRMCSNIGYNIVGGFSKILSLVKRHISSNIVSYVDIRYGTGDSYLKVGFQKLSNSKPNYWYWKKNIVLSRYQTQKHKLKELLKDKFDPSKTELQNMNDAGYDRFFDCGNLKMLLSLTS